MKKIFTLLLLLLSQINFSQQYNFNQLIEMTNDNKVFEIKMIKALNSAYKLNKNTSYLYITLDGSIGASDDIPTNDKKYEELFEFEDGQIYKDSEITDNKLDEDFKIRNKLRKEGKLLNESLIEGYAYVRSELIGLVKYEFIQIGFAEYYDSYQEKARTWYYWESKINKEIIIQPKDINTDYKKLTIEYVNDEDFSNILNQIINESKYIETENDYGSFISSYKYGSYKITSKKRENGKGGIITIYIDVK